MTREEPRQTVSGTVSSDAELVSLSSELDVAEAEVNRAVDCWHHDNSPEAERACEAALDRCHGITDRIENLEATTLDGVKAKLRALDWIYPPRDGGLSVDSGMGNQMSPAEQAAYGAALAAAPASEPAQLARFVAPVTDPDGPARDTGVADVVLALVAVRIESLADLALFVVQEIDVAGLGGRDAGTGCASALGRSFEVPGFGGLKGGLSVASRAALICPYMSSMLVFCLA